MVPFVLTLYLGFASLFPKHTTPSSYPQLKIQAQQKRLNLQQRVHRDPTDSLVYTQAGRYLHTLISDSMLPKWYGTPWEFSGISETPGQGTIACSYLISTVLRDAGFPLNRYKMAQLHSFDEVEQFCTSRQNFHGFDSLQTYCATIPEGLYLLALDNHIGFLEQSEHECYFIHSNYISPGIVMREKLSESQAVRGSNQFLLGAITSDAAVVKKWLMQTNTTFISRF